MDDGERERSPFAGIRAEAPLLLRALLGPAVVSGLGFAASSKGVATWYPGLKKPGFTPPNAVFGPAWGTLYLLMGIADYLVARSDAPEDAIGEARRWYGVQLVLNLLWSVIFFGLRSPFAALVEIVLLWGAVLRTLILFARISRPAALLLVPYLLWVGFAAALNAGIWRLNR